MKKPFKHLTKTDRDMISIFRSKGILIRDIGRQLNRSQTTILREIKRNQRSSNRRIYLPHKAQERADQRHHVAHRHRRLKSFTLRHDIEQMLTNKWSPQIIAGYLKAQGKDYACAESIYQWIYKEASHLIGYLIRSHPKRHPRRFTRPRRICCGLSLSIFVARSHMITV